ncbi:MAG: tRNA lysidine(34) synthetase TilS [Syntrophomonadaceae bacterium]|nr:tRNA lysidine(34) synthetase TilS [Syntrophomonadaceae bacterium]MDD3888894.1 tRNA lysidine(34) synthetase TilS [Syntrophomonadaceae bacterium]MDD4548934.1 tRNA lysidine(34) synthetase TilS [Syntrophomonadaceae bacterium]
MQEKVKNYIKKHRLINPGEMVVTGVSGGPDSMALLHILKVLSTRMNFSITAAHLNHQIRDEADAEELFVREYCQQWQVPFYSRQLDIKKLAADEKKSLEETGREYRYRFFNDLLNNLGGQRIATAHHQDDVAETVLMHLLRGSGIKGLRGILPVNGSIIRPLLAVDKEQLINYLQANGINYCLDKSNYDPFYMRNRIRHQLIPGLQADFNPRIIQNLNQLADIAREENDAIEYETDQLWDKIIIKNAIDHIILDRQALLGLHKAFQRRIILKSLALLKGEPGWNMSDINIIMDMAGKKGSSKKVYLKKGVRAGTCYDHLVIDTRPEKHISFAYPVTIPGEVYITETGEKYVFILVPRENYKLQAGDIYLDYDKLSPELELRSRRTGDVFKPAGLGGHKKLKDFFIDLKIPSAARDKIPLLAAEEKVYAILGMRLAEDVLVDAHTRRILVIKKEGVV